MLSSQSNNDINTRRLLELIDIPQLRQHINIPTKTTIKTQALIGIIITKNDDIKIIQSGVTDLGISDHNLHLIV